MGIEADAEAEVVGRFGSMTYARKVFLSLDGHCCMGLPGNMRRYHLKSFLDVNILFHFKTIVLGQWYSIKLLFNTYVVFAMCQILF